MNEDLLRNGFLNYPKLTSKYLSYGTAGFRANHEILQSTFFRMGILAVLRSIEINNNNNNTINNNDILSVGLMVTASHNQEIDNGIKLIDKDGGMLIHTWEQKAREFANIEDIESFIDYINEFMNNYNNKNGKVFIGRDTRFHSENLSNIAIQGIEAIGGEYINVGLVTTPQLHHIIRMENGLLGQDFALHSCKEEWRNIDGYNLMIVDSFLELINTKDNNHNNNNNNNNIDIHVDCAHGIGSIALESLLTLLNEKRNNNLNYNILIENKVNEGQLNFRCGAEYVQKGQLSPINFRYDNEEYLDEGKVNNLINISILPNFQCSFDGDADRIVFYYKNDSSWNLLDGDKIASLFALFIQDELNNIDNLPEDLKFSVIQTAYANGASTNYLKSLNIPIYTTKTGVKYLHHEALNYDISIYFEANGHGTCIFSPYALETIYNINDNESDRSKLSKQRLKLLHHLINQAIGDAISDFFVVLSILILKDWNINEWNSIYTDLPSKQSKLPVQDRSIIKCNLDETKTLEPITLQEEIDKLVNNVENGRAFVRPSGTEDVVRIYAEGKTLDDAINLSRNVAKVVYHIAGGIGDEP